MTVALNSALVPTTFGLNANPDDIRQTVDVWIDTKRGPQLCPWDDGMLWPNSRMMGGDPSASLYLVGQDANMGNRYESLNCRTDGRGAQSQLYICGFTQDSNGDPLSSCIVKAYRTSDDLEVGVCTSDGGGYFAVPSPYVGVAHYVVCYKAGSPDVVGTSLNTLVPS